MKILFRALIVLAALILASLAALHFWVGPKVEEMARLELAQLPQRAAFAAGLQFSAPQVREIKFSPFSRRLIVRGLEIRGTISPLDLKSRNPRRQPAPGQVRYTLEEGSYRLPLRALLLYTPLRGLLLPEKGMITIGEDMRLSHFASVVTQTSIRTENLMKSETATDIRMEGALIRQLLEEREASEAAPREQSSGPQAGRRPVDLLSLAYRMGIGELRISGMRTRVLVPQEKISVELDCEAMRMRNWQGRSVQEAVMDDISLKLKGQELLRLGSLAEKEITLPEEAALRELLAQVNGPNPDPKTLQDALLGLFISGEPLFKELSVADLRIPVNGESDPAVTLTKAALHWPSNTPLRYSFNVDALSLPTNFLKRESGLAFPGLPAVVLDATLEVAARGADAARAQGTLQAQGLGALEYDLLLSGQGRALTSKHILLGRAFGDVRLKYADQGLTAYLVRNVLPSAQEATPILKAAIAAFCSGPAPENPAIREALDTFATLPGVLEAQSKPGKTFSILDLVGLLAGDPGTLFTVTAQPGKESLEAQINRLNAIAASPAK